jgi:hypothetical protein
MSKQLPDFSKPRGVSVAILIDEKELVVESGSDLKWSFDGSSMQAVFRNRRKKPVRLRRFTLARLPLKIDLKEWSLGTLNHWDHPHQFPQTVTDFLTIYRDQGRKGLVLGAVGTEADVEFKIDTDQTLTITSEMTDVIVGPGESRVSERVMVAAGPYHDAVKTVIGEIARTHGTRTEQGALFGWCSWYHKALGVAARDVTNFAKVARKLPVDVIQVDDGYQVMRGDWRPNQKFPGGWKPVLKHIHAAKAMAGVWLAPVLVDEALGFDKKHPAWFQRDAAGKSFGCLDPSHPGANRFIRDIIRQHTKLGFTYFKIDFTFINAGARFHDPTKTRYQIFRDLYKLYREELGDIYLLACLVAFKRPVVGLADAVRIGVDSMAVWKETHGICISRCIPAVGATAELNDVLFANDPDVTYTWPHQLTTPEWQTWHSFVGLLGGTAMISEPLHVGEQKLGRVECRIEGTALRLQAKVNDIAIRVDEKMPWEASCVEIFGCADGGSEFGQIFLLPDGTALRVEAGKIVAESGIACRVKRRSGGYTLEATIPLSFVKVATAAKSLRLEARIFTTVNADYGLASATLFGSNMPYQTTARYGLVRRGKPVGGDLKVASIADTARVFEILNPPLPCGAKSFHAGTDPWHRQFGYVVGEVANILLWNPDEVTADLTLDLPGFAKQFHVWSFWDERYLGIGRDKFVVKGVPAHGCVVLRLTPLKEEPVLIGSTLHITMGLAEVRSAQTTEEGLVLDLSDAGARAGALYFYSAGKLAVAAVKGFEVVAVKRMGNLWKVEIKARRRGRAQSLVLTGWRP